MPINELSLKLSLEVTSVFVCENPPLHVTVSWLVFVGTKLLQGRYHLRLFADGC